MKWERNKVGEREIERGTKIEDREGGGIQQQRGREKYIDQRREVERQKEDQTKR